jgi:IS1 family transposase
MDVETMISLLAFVLALASFVISAYSDRQRRKAEELKELLGEKESVAFAALRLLRDGLPTSAVERERTLDGVIQACLFERSDRTRTILFEVLERNQPRYAAEIDRAYNTLARIFDGMAGHNFTKEQLDLTSGRRRLGAVAKILGKEAPAPG